MGVVRAVRVWATIGSVTVLALAACAGDGAVPVARTVSPTVVVDKTAPPDPVVPTVWPLTGVAGDVVPRPAVAVKIENTAQARPQTGLEGADVVWEEIVEFGVSRLVAVYHSQLPAEVGPIRSVRPADAKIASPLLGLIAFSGGQGPILDVMAATPLQLLSHDDGDDGFYRVRTRTAPHNVYGSLTDFLAQADADHQASPPEQFIFARRAAAATAVRSGRDASTVSLRLAPGVSPTWTWDATTGRWLRSETSGASFSSAGARLAADNVVVVEVEEYDSGFDAQLGEPVPDLRLVGSGAGAVASGGRVLDVAWSKASQDAPLVLTAPDGESVELAPGTTWVELVPQPGGSWSVS